MILIPVVVEPRNIISKFSIWIAVAIFSINNGTFLLLLLNQGLKKDLNRMPCLVLGYYLKISHKVFFLLNLYKSCSSQKENLQILYATLVFLVLIVGILLSNGV